MTSTTLWYKAAMSGRGGVYWVRNPLYEVHCGSLTDALALNERNFALFLAYHEAAHAVLGMVAGERVHALKLLPGAGRTTFDQRGADPWGSMLAAAGGERASDRWLREVGAWTPLAAIATEMSAASDRDRVIAAHSYVGFGPSAPLDYGVLHDAADERLETHWEGIAAVAHELADCRILAGDVAAKLAGLTNSRRLSTTR